MALEHIVNDSPVEVKHLNLNTNQPINYLIKEGKLVFADSGLYLKGETNYTVVGSPTIVDGVVSNFSTSNRLLTTGTGGYLVGKNWEIGMKIKTPASYGSYTNVLFGSSLNGTRGGGIYIVVTTSGILRFTVGATTGSNFVNIEATSALSAQNDYWIKAQRIDTSYSFSVSADGVTYTQIGSQTSADQIYNTSDPFIIGAGYANYFPFYGSIDLKETYIKADNSLWFYGKCYGKSGVAPVPSGFTYGNVTTSTAGWVDIITQAFTAAPSGATVGRDS